MAASTSITFDRAALDQLDKLFANHMSSLKDIARNMSKRVNGIGGGGGMPGIRGGDGTDEDIRKELQSFLQILRNNNKTLTATERYQQKAADRELKAVNERIKAAEAERKANEKNGAAREDNTGAVEDNTDKIKKSADRLGHFAEKVAGGTLSFTAMTKAVNEFSQAYKQGFNWNAMSDTINAALDMGMSPKDMMDFQKRFRRVSNTFEGGIDEFNKTIAASNVEWMHYTGSLKDAANAQAEMYDLALSIGVGAKDMKSAVGGMFGEFKKLQVATSMTAEEFIATQKSLSTEKTVRDKLIGLQGKERINYLNKLTDTTYMFQTLGLQKEAAEGLVKMIEAQSGKTALSRLRTGAQAQGIAQQFGLSADEGGRLNTLLVKKNKNEKEMTEFTDLMKKFSTGGESMRNSGINGELMYDALRQRMPDLFDAADNIGGPAALASGAEASPTALLKQQQDIAARDEGFWGKVIEKLVQITDILGGWSQSMLAAFAAFGVSKLVAGSIPKVLGKWGRGAGAGAGGAGGAGGGAGAGGAGGAGAGGRIASLGSLIAEYGPKLVKTGLVAGAVAGVAEAAIDATTTQGGMANSLLTGASRGAGLGATVGAIGGPMGIIAGTFIGGAAGALAGFVLNQDKLNDGLDEQKKKIIEQTSLDELRYRKAKESYENEIKALDIKGNLSKEELARYDELKAKMDAATKEHESAGGRIAASQLGYQLSTQDSAKDWISQAANGIQKGGFFGGGTSASDINAQIAQMQAKLKAAGLSMTDEDLRARISKHVTDIASTKTGDERDAGWAASDGILNNTSYDSKYDKMASPIVAEAIRQILPELSAGFTSNNQASFNNNLSKSPESLLALQDQVHAAADQIQKDKDALAASQFVPDEFGASTANNANLQKRIEQNQALLDGIQRLATNSDDKTVKFESEKDLVETLKKLQETLDKNPVKPVKR